jgi:hypothetical protein
MATFPLVNWGPRPCLEAGRQACNADAEAPAGVVGAKFRDRSVDQQLNPGELTQLGSGRLGHRSLVLELLLAEHLGEVGPFDDDELLGLAERGCQHGRDPASDIPVAEVLPE